jgi:hypothetical protein
VQLCQQEDLTCSPPIGLREVKSNREASAVTEITISSKFAGKANTTQVDHIIVNGRRGRQCGSYFRNLFVFSGLEPFSAWRMNYHPHSHPDWRSPRARLAEITPVVFRLSDGSCSRGNLEIISLTGGLVCISNVLDRSSRVMLMFLTQTGLVQATAEMLSPVSRTRQPFRFVALEEGAHRKLRTVVQSFLDTREQAWIEKYRAARIHQVPPRRKLFRVVCGALALLALCFGSAIYLFRVPLLK